MGNSEVIHLDKNARFVEVRRCAFPSVFGRATSTTKEQQRARGHSADSLGATVQIAVNDGPPATTLLGSAGSTRLGVRPENRLRTKPSKYRALPSSMTQIEARRISYITILVRTTGWRFESSPAHHLFSVV
jgi:hypothetical protein